LIDPENFVPMFRKGTPAPKIKTLTKTPHEKCPFYPFPVFPRVPFFCGTLEHWNTASIGAACRAFLRFLLRNTPEHAGTIPDIYPVLG
jgi:hypothetical protein